MDNVTIAMNNSNDANIDFRADVSCAWPKLDSVGLSRCAVEARRGGIGGSDANVILSGNSDRIRRLWQEKRGEVEPEDLSAVLPVALGSWTEAFNRQWYERVSGQSVDRVGEVICCVDHGWRRCTLDGFTEDGSAIWEAKHTGAFTKSDDVLERYMPQLQHNMAVSKVDRAVLSAIFGNHKYEIFEVASDWVYQLELLEAEADFWDCVTTGREPVPALPPVPPRPIGVREVCLEGNNAWAVAAGDWLENHEAAKLHANACTEIKGLIEPDVARAFGHRIEAKRSKAGAITIKEMAQ